MLRPAVFLCAVCWTPTLFGQIAAERAVVYFDFARGLANAAPGGGELTWSGGERKTALEFVGARDAAESDAKLTAAVSRGLHEAKAISVGGWFQPRRVGEQVFFGRGDLQTGPLGERRFPADERFVNFCLGTDNHGFLLGAINGNGRMPFPFVTLSEVTPQAWHQLVVVKDADGFQRFYHNGVCVADDRGAFAAPATTKHRETELGERRTLRLGMSSGGLIGEAWVFARELTADEIASDFAAKKLRYVPAPEVKPVALRAMQPSTLAPDPPFDRERILAEVMKLLGPFPKEKSSLEPRVHSEEDCGTYLRRKVSIQVQPDDRMPAWLLIPKGLTGKAPAVICFYGTTSGAGKDFTVGLSGRAPGSPPQRNMSFALDVVEAGCIAFAPDYLRDGERVHPGDRPYDTTRFYEKFPDWSIHGKDAWDTMRAIDYLQSLEIVDGDRLGMIGHSYGGHSTIFTAALEPRIKVAVANGPVSAFREHGMHWGLPKGAGGSQSLPAMRPYLLEPNRPLPVTFAQWTALIAPRALWVGQAVGEHRPREEENCDYVGRVYQAQGVANQVRYGWYPGDHDFPPAARADARQWLRKHFSLP